MHKTKFLRNEWFAYVIKVSAAYVFIGWLLLYKKIFIRR